MNDSTVPAGRNRLRLVEAIRSDPTVGHAATGLAVHMLWTYTDDSLRAAWPSQATIAESYGVGEGYVKRLLRQLREAGWLHVEVSRPERGADGRWFRRRTNRYRWAWRRACAVATRAIREAYRRALDAKAQVTPRGTRRAPGTPEGVRGIRRAPRWGGARGGRGEVVEVYRPPDRGEHLCGRCHGCGWVENEAGMAVRCGC